MKERVLRRGGEGRGTYVHLHVLDHSPATTDTDSTGKGQAALLTSPPSDLGLRFEIGTLAWVREVGSRRVRMCLLTGRSRISRTEPV